MSAHRWVKDYGPNKNHNYYMCSECGVYMAEPARGEFGFRVWSANSFNAPADRSSDLTLGGKERFAGLGIPTCSEYKSLKMDNALK